MRAPLHIKKPVDGNRRTGWFPTGQWERVHRKKIALSVRERDMRKNLRRTRIRDNGESIGISNLFRFDEQILADRKSPLDAIPVPGDRFVSFATGAGPREFAMESDLLPARVMVRFPVRRTPTSTRVPVHRRTWLAILSSPYSDFEPRYQSRGENLRGRFDPFTDSG